MASDHEAIMQGLNRYAAGCDRRDWALLESVFTEDVAFNYGGEYSASGRARLVKMIKNSLGGCGPTQHLLGNYSIDVSGDRANSVCYVRAFHVGAGKQQSRHYEVWGGYTDRWLRVDAQWKIHDRKMWITYEQGSRDVLAP